MTRALAAQNSSSSWKAEQVTRAIAIHRLELKPGTDPAKFEELVRSEVFPGLGIVFQLNKMMSHDFTKISWVEGENVLTRDTGQTAGSRVYLWTITAPVDDSRLATDEGRQAVESELAKIGDSFFSMGMDTEGSIETSAAHKLTPFATRSSFDTYLEVTAWPPAKSS